MERVCIHLTRKTGVHHALRGLFFFFGACSLVGCTSLHLFIHWRDRSTRDRISI